MGFLSIDGPNFESSTVRKHRLPSSSIQRSIPRIRICAGYITIVALQDGKLL